MTIAPAPGPTSPRRPRRGRGPAPDRTWLLVFVVALSVPLAYTWLAAGPDAAPSTDTASYDTVAWNLARGAGFSLGENGGAYPTAFVPRSPRGSRASSTACSAARTSRRWCCNA